MLLELVQGVAQAVEGLQAAQTPRVVAAGEVHLGGSSEGVYRVNQYIIALSGTSVNCPLHTGTEPATPRQPPASRDMHCSVDDIRAHVLHDGAAHVAARGRVRLQHRLLRQHHPAAGRYMFSMCQAAGQHGICFSGIIFQAADASMMAFTDEANPSHACGRSVCGHEPQRRHPIRVCTPGGSVGVEEGAEDAQPEADHLDGARHRVEGLAQPALTQRAVEQRNVEQPDEAGARDRQHRPEHAAQSDRHVHACTSINVGSLLRMYKAGGGHVATGGIATTSKSLVLTRDECDCMAEMTPAMLTMMPVAKTAPFMLRMSDELRSMTNVSTRFSCRPPMSEPVKHIIVLSELIRWVLHGLNCIELPTLYTGVTSSAKARKSGSTRQAGCGQDTGSSACICTAAKSTWEHVQDGQGGRHEDGPEDALPAQQLVRVHVHVAEEDLLEHQLDGGCSGGGDTVRSEYPQMRAYANRPLLQRTHAGWTDNSAQQAAKSSYCRVGNSQPDKIVSQCQLDRGRLRGLSRSAPTNWLSRLSTTPVMTCAGVASMRSASMPLATMMKLDSATANTPTRFRTILHKRALVTSATRQPIIAGHTATSPCTAM